MRNLQSRLEEIRRRSEIGIQKKKKRRKLLVSVLSSGLCICLCLGSLWLLGKDRVGEDGISKDSVQNAPPLMDEAPNGAAGSQDSSAEHAPGATVVGDMEVAENSAPVPENSAPVPQSLEVTMQAHTHSIDSAHTLTRVQTLLGSLHFAQQPTYGSNTDNGTDADASPCTFTLIYTDGSQITYRLTDTTLENTQTAERVRLTPDQLSQLRNLLSLDIP